MMKQLIFAVLTLISSTTAWGYETGPANSILTVPASGGRPRFVPLGVHGPDTLENLALSTSVGSNALTISIKNQAGTDPTSTSSVRIAFRSTSATGGTYNVRTISGPSSIVIPTGASLGHSNSTDQYVHVYAMDNAGTVEWAVSGSPIGNTDALQTTTALSASATSRTTLYSGLARSNLPVRYIARLKSNQATAGTWASSISEIILTAISPKTQVRSQVILTTGAGHGNPTNVAWRRFNSGTTIGTAITYLDTAADGAKLTINEDGVYAISYVDSAAAAVCIYGISLNSAEPTTSIVSITAASRLGYTTSQSAGNGTQLGWTGILSAGDVIRPHDSTLCNSTAGLERFQIVKVSD